MKFNFKLPHKIPTWLKYIFALIPIIWIFNSINVKEMLQVFSKIAWWTAPCMVSVILLTMFLQGVRWWMLLRAFIPSINFSRVIFTHFSGIFYSIVLPTSAAQDAVRAALLSRENDYSIAWASTIVSRILGLLALVFLSIYGLILIDKNSLPRGFFYSILVISVAFLLVVFISFSKKATRPLRAIFTKIMPAKLTQIVENIRQGIYVYRNKKMDLFWVFLFTLFIQFLLIFGVVSLLLCGISGKLYFAESFSYVPLIDILSMSIPLTPGGLGIREFMLKIMFNHLGLSNEQVGVFIVLGFLAILLKLFGGVFVLIDFLRKKPGRT
jgi:uncharacterized protein (TIRG00374 family)